MEIIFFSLSHFFKKVVEKEISFLIVVGKLLQIQRPLNRRLSFCSARNPHKLR